MFSGGVWYTECDGVVGIVAEEEFLVFVAARVKQSLGDNGRCSGRSRSMDSFDFARLCRLLACEAAGWRKQKAGSLLRPNGFQGCDISFVFVIF